MKFNMSSSHDIAEAQRLLSQLTVDKKTVEIKEIKPRRSLQQNNYLYLLLSAFGVHFGNDIEYVKRLYKYINKDIYYRKMKLNDEVFETVRSSAELTKDEMAASIDKFWKWSAEEAGYTLPLATDVEWIRRLENEIESQKKYL